MNLRKTEIVSFQNCLSLNSSSRECCPQSLGSLMSPEVDLCTNNRATAFQRMAMKKYLSSPHQNSSSTHHHHSHGHNRGHHYGSNQNSSFLNSFMHEKNCCSTGNHMMTLNSPPINILDPQLSLERVARFHRSAAGNHSLIKIQKTKQNCVSMLTNYCFSTL